MREGMKKRSTVVRLRVSPVRRLRGHQVGILVGQSSAGPLIDYTGNQHGPLVARCTVPLQPHDGARIEVLLVFEDERSDQPIIVGVLQPNDPPGTSPRPVEGKLEARVDGRRVQIEAEDEIELRCGEASITLRRNGRVVIRGAYVETRSRGVNRIKGGAVQIN
jgi:hypothetical protein